MEESVGMHTYGTLFLFVQAINFVMEGLVIKRRGNRRKVAITAVSRGVCVGRLGRTQNVIFAHDGCQRCHPSVRVQENQLCLNVQQCLWCAWWVLNEVDGEVGKRKKCTSEMLDRKTSSRREKREVKV